MLAPFEPDEESLKGIADIMSQEPVPLEELSGSGY